MSHSSPEGYGFYVDRLEIVKPPILVLNGVGQLFEVANGDVRAVLDQEEVNEMNTIDKILTMVNRPEDSPEDGGSKNG
jgi:hypothetical protein